MKYLKGINYTGKAKNYSNLKISNSEKIYKLKVFKTCYRHFNGMLKESTLGYVYHGIIVNLVILEI